MGDTETKVNAKEQWPPCHVAYHSYVQSANDLVRGQAVLTDAKLYCGGGCCAGCGWRGCSSSYIIYIIGKLFSLNIILH